MKGYLCSLHSLSRPTSDCLLFSAVVLKTIQGLQFWDAGCTTQSLPRDEGPTLQLQRLLPTENHWALPALNGVTSFTVTSSCFTLLLTSDVIPQKPLRSLLQVLMCLKPASWKAHPMPAGSRLCTDTA